MKEEMKQSERTIWGDVLGQLEAERDIETARFCDARGEDLVVIVGGQFQQLGPYVLGPVAGFVVLRVFVDPGDQSPVGYGQREDRPPRSHSRV